VVRTTTTQPPSPAPFEPSADPSTLVCNIATICWPVPGPQAISQKPAAIITRVDMTPRPAANITRPPRRCNQTQGHKDARVDGKEQNVYEGIPRAIKFNMSK